MKSFLQTFYNVNIWMRTGLTCPSTRINPADVACKWIMEAAGLLSKKTIDQIKHGFHRDQYRTENTVAEIPPNEKMNRQTAGHFHAL
jgi:hypothetical protein